MRQTLDRHVPRVPARKDVPLDRQNHRSARERLRPEAGVLEFEDHDDLFRHDVRRDAVQDRTVGLMWSVEHPWHRVVMQVRYDPVESSVAGFRDAHIELACDRLAEEAGERCGAREDVGFWEVAGVAGGRSVANGEQGAEEKAVLEAAGDDGLERVPVVVTDAGQRMVVAHGSDGCANVPAPDPWPVVPVQEAAENVLSGEVRSLHRHVPVQHACYEPGILFRAGLIEGRVVDGLRVVDYSRRVGVAPSWTTAFPPVATVVAGFHAADKAKVCVAGLANDVVASIHETADPLAARTPLDLDAPGAAIRKSGLAGLCQSESSCLRHVCVVEVVAQNLAIVLHI